MYSQTLRDWKQCMYVVDKHVRFSKKELTISTLPMMWFVGFSKIWCLKAVFLLHGHMFACVCSFHPLAMDFCKPSEMAATTFFPPFKFKAKETTLLLAHNATSSFSSLYAHRIFFSSFLLCSHVSAFLSPIYCFPTSFLLLFSFSRYPIFLPFVPSFSPMFLPLPSSLMSFHFSQLSFVSEDLQWDDGKWRSTKTWRS